MQRDNKIYNLPEGWIWTTIGEIGIVTSGGTPSTGVAEFWGGDIPWITPSDLSNYDEMHISKGSRNITKLGLEYSSAKILPKGSILFSSRAPIGYVVIAKNDVATSQGFKNLIISKHLCAEYLYYYFKTIKPLAEKMASGTTFLELSATKFSQIPFLLPPLKEQQRIVTKVEELFSELNQAETALKKAQKQLEIYKQALLKSIFQRKEGSKLIKLSELGTILTGNTPLKNNADFFGGEFNFYKPSDLNTGLFVVNSLDKLTSNGYRASRTAPEGSILVTCIGATIGKTGLIRKEGAFNQQINAIIPNQNFLPEFIYYQIISPEFQLQLKQKTSSTTIPIINKGKFLQLNVIQFPLDLQQQIVQELESKFTLIENLEITIENELKKTKAFSQTILKKAFEGNLLQQNANDEQAIYLLEKIQIEKNNFLKLQKENIKKKTKIERVMESEKSILEILQQLDTPISAHELWQQSVHHADIEKFYAELKTIQCKIEEIREGMNTKIHLKP